MQASTDLTGVQLDGNVHTAVVSNNVLMPMRYGVGCPQADDPNALLRNVFCAGAVLNIS